MRKEGKKHEEGKLWEKDKEVGKDSVSVIITNMRKGKEKRA